MSDVDHHVFLSLGYAVYTRDVGLTAPESAFTALNFDIAASQSPDPSSSISDSSSSDDSVVSPGIIVGGVVGGLAVLTGFVLLIHFYRRDIQRNQPPKSPHMTIPRPYTMDVYSISERGQFGSPYPFPTASNAVSYVSIPRRSASSRSGRTLVTPAPSNYSITGYSNQQTSVDYGPVTRSHSRASRSGSVENQIRVANRRMRSLRAELASFSGQTPDRSDNTRSNSSRAMEGLSEEVRMLREEIQALKQQQLQRQQRQQRQQQPPQPQPQPPQRTTAIDDEPPPTYTDSDRHGIHF